MKTLITIIIFAFASNIANPTPLQAQSVRQKVMTRIFWQDRESGRLSYADLKTSDRWSMQRGWIKGFPTLDSEKQSLVQMKQSDGILLVGVRDTESGEHQSGWVAVDTGVFEEPHGNHTHWKYTRVPSVTQKKLDAEQGNPAHVYVYHRNFFVANDSKNGFTMLFPNRLRNPADTAATQFFNGGGNHITLAAVDNKVAYSSWIDGGGPNTGRVDVVNLQKATPEIAYSFQLPTGVIHGATANSGKVFLAPTDGICWVEVDGNLIKSADDVQVNHLSLGVDSETEKPLRTGAFANSRNWVLCSTGSADQSALCLMNAASPAPEIIKVPIDVQDGLKLTTPVTVLSLGRRYAFLFQNRTDAESDVQEKMTIVELDPNKDRDFSDAKVKMSIDVGASMVSGHHGHHALTFDAYGRYAIYTEPADGLISVMSLRDFRTVARFRVGGVPDSILAVGAPEHFH